MRCYVGARGSAASTAARGPSVYAIASRPLWIVEVGVFNTTTTACVVALQRASTTGTQGAGLTEICEDTDITPVGTGFNTHTADATITSGEFARATLGAAAGAGVIWTFGKNGVKIDPGTGNGAVITTPTGTGQVCDFYIIWEE